MQIYKNYIFLFDHLLNQKSWIKIHHHAFLWTNKSLNDYLLFLLNINTSKHYHHHIKWLAIVLQLMDVDNMLIWMYYCCSAHFIECIWVEFQGTRKFDSDQFLVLWNWRVFFWLCYFQDSILRCYFYAFPKS